MTKLLGANVPSGCTWAENLTTTTIVLYSGGNASQRITASVVLVLVRGSRFLSSPSLSQRVQQLIQETVELVVIAKDVVPPLLRHRDVVAVAVMDCPPGQGVTRTVRLPELVNDRTDKSSIPFYRSANNWCPELSIPRCIWCSRRSPTQC